LTLAQPCGLRSDNPWQRKARPKSGWRDKA
jgi:hypothetical protein